MIRSGCSLRVRLWPSWPGFAPPGFAFSRLSLRSVAGGFEDVRDVFSGRCRRRTRSISSALLRRSSSSRLIPTVIQTNRSPARGCAQSPATPYPWVITGAGAAALRGILEYERERAQEFRHRDDFRLMATAGILSRG